MHYSQPAFSVHGILQAEILQWAAILSQGIFPTQGSNLSLLHGRQILYRLSHQEYSFDKIWWFIRVERQARGGGGKGSQWPRQPTPVFLPGKFHGQMSLGGLQSRGSQGVRRD